MSALIDVEEKYVRNGWPSLPRPDLKPPEGWSLSLITAVNRIRSHRLSPDGNQIAFIWDREDLSDIYRLPAAGGWPLRVTTHRELVAYWDDELPQWSPDSQWLAFTLDDHVHVAPAEGGLPQKVSGFAPAASTPVWMPDSRGLVVSVERDDAIQFVLTDRDGSWPRPLVTDTDADAWDAQPSPDGRSVAYVHRPFADLNRQDIRLVDLESGQVRTLAGTAKVLSYFPRWSPDGSQIAFISEQSGFNEIWLVRPDGEGLRRLTHAGMDFSDIAWSPDGARLACTVNRRGAFDLALVDSQSGELSILRPCLGVHARPCWSPDGKFLTFEYEDPSSPPDLYRLDLETKQATQLTFSNLPALAVNSLVIPEQVIYTSYDGLEIPAFLYRPARPNGAAIVHPHGGPSGQYAYSWDILAQYFVAKGYHFLAPNYRGSTGYGLEFEHANYNDWGHGDTEDCLYAANFLQAQPGIDPERLAIYGGSYGGYLTICCLSRDPQYRYACGVSKYGDANLVSSWAQCNRRLRLYSEIFLGHPSQNREAYRRGSPIYQAGAVQKPMLILHGLLDDVVPPQASEEWVEALRREGKTFEYKTYAGEPHGFLMRKTQLDAYQRIERFLDWYLLP